MHHLSGDQQLLKSLNRMAIVRELGRNPGQSRAAVAESLQLTKSTVSLLVRELSEEGWLFERDALITGEVGRRPTPLFIDPDRLVLLGAELSVQQLRVVATTLTGEVLERVSLPLVTPCDADSGLALLAHALLKLRAKLQLDGQRIIGIGVGLPGGVDAVSGQMRHAPNLGWRDVPARAMLAHQLGGSALAGVPIFVQNNADAAAIGEVEFNAGTADSSASAPLVYLNIGQGVGAGIFVQDQLLTGAHGFAGEVGHTILQLDGPVCACGRNGCAEAVVGLRAMQPEGEAPLTANVDAIRQRLNRGDADTHERVARAGRYLGMLLWNLNAAYDPGRIVLGGPAVELGEAFLAPALHTLQQYLDRSGSPAPHIGTARSGAEAVAIGAAALARYRLTHPPLTASPPLAAAA